MPSPITKTSSSSSSIRFMGLLKQPDSDPNNILLEEFDENDVFWSEFPDSTTLSNSFSPPTPTRLLPQRATTTTLYKPSNSGLSAALTHDHHPLVRRKSTLNPSVSATSPAKMIPPVFRSENSFPKFHHSAPVNVPVWQKKDGPVGGLDRFDEVDDELEDEEMIPPHVMVAQSHVTFSVFEGVGRTLKGRDLRRVRNVVFQKTGFID
ncbi:hypothetical protein K7X08_035337 [Anisodus acutangulus]|uniref:Senescence regulator S40 n=1 Tax=Anisodus acutangulus TaxID=402998 RepID=A0A9Q1LKI6_9SOLA|nr:hypothetical protein K7X08_035337 [Anisodus acutangulus]